MKSMTKTQSRAIMLSTLAAFTLFSSQILGGQTVAAEEGTKTEQQLETKNQNSDTPESDGSGSVNSESSETESGTHKSDETESSTPKSSESESGTPKSGESESPAEGTDTQNANNQNGKRTISLVYYMGDKYLDTQKITFEAGQVGTSLDDVKLFNYVIDPDNTKRNKDGSYHIAVKETKDFKISYIDEDGKSLGTSTIRQAVDQGELDPNSISAPDHYTIKSTAKVGDTYQVVVTKEAPEVTKGSKPKITLHFVDESGKVIKTETETPDDNASGIPFTPDMIPDGYEVDRDPAHSHKDKEHEYTITLIKVKKILSDTEPDKELEPTDIQVIFIKQHFKDQDGKMVPASDERVGEPVTLTGVTAENFKDKIKGLQAPDGYTISKNNAGLDFAEKGPKTYYVVVTGDKKEDTPTEEPEVETPKKEEPTTPPSNLNKEPETTPDEEATETETDVPDETVTDTDVTDEGASLSGQPTETVDTPEANTKTPVIAAATAVKDDDATNANVAQPAIAAKTAVIDAAATSATPAVAAASLPQTGDQSNLGLTIAGLITTLMTGLAALGFRRRRN